MIIRNSVSTPKVTSPLREKTKTSLTALMMLLLSFSPKLYGEESIGRELAKIDAKQTKLEFEKKQLSHIAENLKEVFAERVKPFSHNKNHHLDRLEGTFRLPIRYHLSLIYSAALKAKSSEARQEIQKLYLDYLNSVKTVNKKWRSLVIKKPQKSIEYKNPDHHFNIHSPLMQVLSGSIRLQDHLNEESQEKLIRIISSSLKYVDQRLSHRLKKLAKLSAKKRLSPRTALKLRNQVFVLISNNIDLINMLSYTKAKGFESLVSKQCSIALKQIIKFINIYNSLCQKHRIRDKEKEFLENGLISALSHLIKDPELKQKHNELLEHSYSKKLAWYDKKIEDLSLNLHKCNNPNNFKKTIKDIHRLFSITIAKILRPILIGNPDSEIRHDFLFKLKTINEQILAIGLSKGPAYNKIAIHETNTAWINANNRIKLLYNK